MMGKSLVTPALGLVGLVVLGLGGYNALSGDSCMLTGCGGCEAESAAMTAAASTDDSCPMGCSGDSAMVMTADASAGECEKSCEGTVCPVTGEVMAAAATTEEISEGAACESTCSEAKSCDEAKDCSEPCEKECSEEAECKTECEKSEETAAL